MLFCILSRTASVGLLRTFLREPREEPLKGPLPNLIVDVSSSFLLQDCVATHPENVVRAANAEAFAKRCKLCLRILAQLNTFVHCSTNICIGSELICDLTGPHSNSERGASSGHCGDGGPQAYLVHFDSAGLRAGLQRS